VTSRFFSLFLLTFWRWHGDNAQGVELGDPMVAPIRLPFRAWLFLSFFLFLLLFLISVSFQVIESENEKEIKNNSKKRKKKEKENKKIKHQSAS